MKQWVLLFATRSYAEAGIVQGMLEENQIPVQVLNKLDSSYINFGDIELYVPGHLRDVAKQLLGNSFLN
ncbi:putative signal transducing protein [Chitinophagaceae bacterium LWZ2-11]